jgi:hypothetical protein
MDPSDGPVVAHSPSSELLRQSFSLVSASAPRPATRSPTLCAGKALASRVSRRGCLMGPEGVPPRRPAAHLGFPRWRSLEAPQVVAVAPRSASPGYTPRPRRDGRSPAEAGHALGLGWRSQPLHGPLAALLHPHNLGERRDRSPAVRARQLDHVSEFSRPSARIARYAPSKWPAAWSHLLSPAVLCGLPCCFVDTKIGYFMAREVVRVESELSRCRIGR